MDTQLVPVSFIYKDDASINIWGLLKTVSKVVQLFKFQLIINKNFYSKH